MLGEERMTKGMMDSWKDGYDMGVPYDAVPVRSCSIEGMVVVFECSGRQRFHISIRWREELLQHMLIVLLTDENQHGVQKSWHRGAIVIMPRMIVWLFDFHRPYLQDNRTKTRSGDHLQHSYIVESQDATHVNDQSVGK